MNPRRLGPFLIIGVVFIVITLATGQAVFLPIGLAFVAVGIGAALGDGAEPADTPTVPDEAGHRGSSAGARLSTTFRARAESVVPLTLEIDVRPRLEARAAGLGMPW